MSKISNLLMVTFVVCLSAKYVSSIECFVCGSISESTTAVYDSLDGSDRSPYVGSDKNATEVKGCHKVNHEMIYLCSQAECSIQTLAKKNGEIIKVGRYCGIPNQYVKNGWDAGMIEGAFETSSGRLVEWSVCEDHLCNWGVMNKYQTITMFAIVMLSLTV